MIRTAVGGEAMAASLLGGESALPERLAIALRMAAGAPTAGDVRTVCGGFARWLAEEVPLEHALALPSNFDARRRLLRDWWIVEAAKSFDDPRPWPRAVALTEAWNTFLSRGPWRRCRDDPQPPVGMDARLVALFWASRLNRGQSLDPRHILRILAH